MKVAVIGGAGRMGNWLVQHFKMLGYDVVISDVRLEEAKRTAERYGIKVSKTNVEAASNSEITVISVPIRETPLIIDQVKEKLKKGSILMEISSIKQHLTQKLREVSSNGVNVLSLHPLFGPSVEKLRNKKLILVPISDAVQEEKFVRSLFPNMKIITLEAMEHDRLMAITLSLTYFMNSVLADILSREDITFLRRVGGTTFTLQLLISESIFAEDLSLLQMLVLDNKFGLPFINKFVETSHEVVGWIREKDEASLRSFYEETRKRLRKDPDFSESYNRLYEALSVISS
ncbi:MAG: prephenate dehydrogenase/arogenate dehydrogenase family protein [Candidatus Bathyarchaeia archaeon]